MKTEKRKGLHSNLARFFCPKLGEDQKKSTLKFSPVFGPKLSAGQTKRSSPTVCVLKPSAQVTKRGPCRNFASYSMLINYPGETMGCHGPMPLPPKYAPVQD